MAANSAFIYSSNYLRERTPYFRLEIDGAPLPPRAMKFVEYLNLEESEGKKGILEFKIRDPEARTFDAYLFALQQQVTVYAGYITEYEARGPFEIVDVDMTFEREGISLKIKGETGGSLGRRVSRRVFTSGTVRKVVEQVARFHGLEMVTEDADGIDFELTPETPITQTGESDGLFLKRIAAEFGWVFTIANKKLHATRAVARKSLGVAFLKYSSADANIMSVNAKFKKPRITYVPLSQATGEGSEVEQNIAPIVNEESEELLGTLEDQLSQANQDLAQLDEEMNATLAFDSISTEEVFTPPAFSAPKTLGDDYPAEMQAFANATVSSLKTDVFVETGGAGTFDAEYFTKPQEEIKADLQKNFKATLTPDLLAGLDRQEQAFVVTINDSGEAVRTPIAAKSAALANPGLSMTPLNTSSTGSAPQTIGTTFDPQEGQCIPICGESKQDKNRIKRRRIIREGKLESLTITLKLGAMQFRPQHNLELEGTGKVLDGQYRVTKVNHNFSTSVPFETILEIKRGFYKPKPKVICTCVPANQPHEQSRSESPTQYVDPATLMSVDPNASYPQESEQVTIGEFGEVQRTKTP